MSLFLLLATTGCQTDTPSAPYVSNVVAYVPLPGSNAAVMYFDISNGGNQAIIVRRVSSPQFERVEMHQSSVSDGIAKMRKLDTLVVAAESTLSLAEGGQHLMLLRPTTALGIGTMVSLSVEFDDGHAIVVATDLVARPLN